MIGDTSLLFLNDTDCQAAASTALVGDVVDLNVADSQQMNGNNLSLVIRVTEAMAGAGTVQFKLASDAAAAISTTTATIHAATHLFLAAQLTLGAVIVIPLPSGVPILERYLGILCTIVGTVTAISASAELVDTADNNKSFADAVN